MSSSKSPLMRHCGANCILTRRVSVPAAAFAGLLASLAAAQADCGTVPFNISQPMVERIVFNREALMQMFPQGGEGLTYWVAIVGSSSRAAMTSLAWTLKVGNNDQKTATIAGLARAARQCESGNRLTSRLIEQTVRDTANASLLSQFTRFYRGQESASSTGLTSMSGSAQPGGTLTDATSALLPERKLQNGLSLYLNREQKLLPSIGQVEPYDPIR